MTIMYFNKIRARIDQNMSIYERINRHVIIEIGRQIGLQRVHLYFTSSCYTENEAVLNVQRTSIHLTTSYQFCTVINILYLTGTNGNSFSTMQIFRYRRSWNFHQTQMPLVYLKLSYEYRVIPVIFIISTRFITFMNILKPQVLKGTGSLCIAIFFITYSWRMAQNLLSVLFVSPAHAPGMVPFILEYLSIAHS